MVKSGDGSDKFVLAFNMTNDKLSDKRVRQAIRYAIDHKQIIASRGGVDAPSAVRSPRSIPVTRI